MPILHRLLLLTMCFTFIDAHPIAADEKVTNSQSCDLALQTAPALNSSQLWQGASDCGKSGNKDGATFLLLAGQVRAMTDMSLLRAATDEDEIKVGDLYGRLYSQTGGSGYDDVYRNPVRSLKLFDRLRHWVPSIDDSYNPGWSYKGKVDGPKYDQIAACQNAVRRQKLSWYANLIQNDDYYAANNALKKLRVANPGAVTVGSDLYKQMGVLQAQKRKATLGISMPRTQPEACDFQSVYEPDPDADFTQLYTGFNGPHHSGASVFRSKDAVIKSWIAKSLSQDDLAVLLDQIDFEKKILVALSVGKRTTVTGTFHISDVNYNSIHKSLNITGLIGVVEEGCDEPRSEAYLFALAVAPRPDTLPMAPGYFQQNFPDGCKPAVSGEPTEVSE
ncbi:MAG: hypothetical protein JKY60_02410 [Kordiimonadaceae bacterium]|nr:hypothetical protein [Kordiimonadaceae bacterium]